MKENSVNKGLWQKKAVAFVARARQEMWGKHNAEMLAFLFEYGFKNRFVEELFIGWNRREKFRDPESWGLDASGSGPGLVHGRLFFPEGLVVPYVVDRHLEKITIARITPGATPQHHVIPGGSPVSMILGQGCRVAVVENVLDGLLLHQEKKEEVCVIIPHDLSSPPDGAAEKLLRGAEEVLLFPDPLSGKNSGFCSGWQNIFPDQAMWASKEKKDILAAFGPGRTRV